MSPDRNRTVTTNAWIHCTKPNPAPRFRLFCFPYAGGGASIYFRWFDHIPAEIDLCPVQLPGRESRLGTPPFTRLVPLLQQLTRVLRPYLQVPFAFFGHSMGALISFELARQLRRQHVPGPIALFVSAHRAPQRPAPSPPIHSLPQDKFVEALRRLNGTPEAVLQDAELMQLLLPTLRADFAVCETYTYMPEVPLECPILAFGGLQDREVSQDDLAAWCDQTHRAFKLRMIPGDHFFLHSARASLAYAVAAAMLNLGTGSI